MNKLYVPGVYLYGCLSLAMLFCANAIAADQWGIAFAIAASGFSYVSSVAGVVNQNVYADQLASGAVAFGLVSLLFFLI
ncbi:hypothetical protein [Roseibium algae]|uniref:Uncharacterized protein n=1 Tax=Roseibium algae TaxID=3123038 RepID=A0ABU8TKB0_9HYPH